jgi:hypothetical protein
MKALLQERNHRNGDLSWRVCRFQPPRSARGAHCLIQAPADTMEWLQPRETTCELAPADFSAFSHRDCIHDKNPLRHLPTAQFASAKFQ